MATRTRTYTHYLLWPVLTVASTYCDLYLLGDRGDQGRWRAAVALDERGGKLYLSFLNLHGYAHHGYTHHARRAHTRSPRTAPTTTYYYYYLLPRTTTYSPRTPYLLTTYSLLTHFYLLPY